LERLEAAKALVAQIDVAREAAVAKYTASVGSKPGRLGHVRYAKSLPKSANSVMSSAVANNPRLKAITSEVDIAHYEKEQFKSRLYPEFFIEGSATRGDDLEGTPGRNDELKAALVMRWRLFDGGVRNGRVAELTERKYEKLAERDIFLRDLKQNVDTAWGRYNKGWAQVGALKRQSKQHKRVLATYQDEYDANKRTLLDVLDAENSNFATEFELSNVEALHIFSSYQLLAQMGVLLERFSIEKPNGSDNTFEIPSARTVTGFGRSFTIPPLNDR